MKGKNERDILGEAESPGRAPQAGAVDAPAASVAGDAPELLLRDAAALYRFGDVGLVYSLAQAERVRVVVSQRSGCAPDAPATDTTVTLPAGNWLLVSVGAIAGMDCPHAKGIDNPYVGAMIAPTPDAPIAPTSPTPRTP